MTSDDVIVTFTGTLLLSGGDACGSVPPVHPGRLPQALETPRMICQLRVVFDFDAAAPAPAPASRLRPRRRPGRLRRAANFVIIWVSIKLRWRVESGPRRCTVTCSPPRPAVPTRDGKWSLISSRPEICSLWLGSGRWADGWWLSCLVVLSGGPWSGGPWSGGP